ncbi:uncharacterized protein K02A2.6-like [Ornithodoros turicata]|uniref:uncharacterized protein K02A2.6-like n=1 Tax=Ornithodoros turicata TaxID=34597 RepID=UPI0031396A08
MFVTVLGDDAYVTLRNLLFPATPETKSYDEMKEVLTKHYKPRRSVVAERYAFHKRVQQSEEPVEDFIVELKRLALTCNFGTFLNDALRDQLVSGIRKEAVRCRLLAVEDGKELTWEKACTMASAMEAAEGQSKEMILRPSGKTPQEVDTMWQGQENTKGGNRPRKGMKRGNRLSGRKKDPSSCYRCGFQHSPAKCPHRKAKCFSCSKIGHLASMCRTKCDMKYVESTSLHELELHNVTDQRNEPFMVEINGNNIPMQVDTGSAVSLMSEKEAKRHFGYVQYRQVQTTLRTYNGSTVPVKGCVDVKVMHNGNAYELPLQIAKNRGNSRMPTLLGRDWLRHLRLNWPQIANIHTVNEKGMVESYRDLFTKNMGVIKNFSASIVLKEGARPVFCKARPVPYALRDKVEKELRELEKQGVISPVQQSQWATPLVVVPKNGGNGVRLCGDYRVTVNPAITVAHYPLPLPEDVFASLSGGTHFTVLDLSKAYLQLEVDESSRELLTVNTSLGLIRMNRLPFGIASAPSIFQSVMDQITTGLQGVACYLDDVLIAGRDPHECVEQTEKVLERLRNHGIKVNSDKCQFFRSKVTYLGHEIDKDGLRPTSDKLKAIREAPTPSNVTELKAFLYPCQTCARNRKKRN